ncbi:T9SS type A sorting domain-containing protein [bacterium]|nr:T9SS type A sorting domain-containing protein [bacterium]
MRKAFLLLFVMLLITAIAGATDVQKEQVNAAIERFNAGYTLSAEEFHLLKSVDFQFNQGPVIDYAGGPDAYGYIFADIDEPDGPTYNWYDISATGTDIAPNLSDDDVEGPLPIGFTFNFYGVPYTNFYVHSNGVIGFTGGFTAPFTNAALPGTFGGPVIAWCWDDFNVASGAAGSVYYETIPDFEPGVDALIVSYVDCAHYGTGSGFMSGQTILLEDGRIITQYDYFDAAWPVDTQTIGLRNADGSIFLQADFDGTPANYPYDDLAIEFSIMAGDANVMGYVTDSSTNDPIAGAMVSIGNGMDETDATGYYEIFDQFSGDNNVMISANGYFTYMGAVVLDPGDNDYDFQMDALPPPVSGDYFTDFEANQGFFDGTGTWEWGTPTSSPSWAYSGDNCWATVLAGNYNDNDDDWLTSVTSFEANDATAMLSYYHFYDYEQNYDGYNLQISFDGGDTWEVKDPIGGYPDSDVVGLDQEPGFNGTTADWEYVEYDFSMYEGQPFWVAFRHGTDSSVNGYSGAAIDDFFWYAGYEYQVLITPVQGTTVPGSGGMIVYSAELINNVGAPMQFDAWTWATLPDGSNYGPIQQVPVVIQPGSTTIPQLVLQVPGMAPTGLYTYHAAIGDFPNTIVYEDIFYFWKVGFGSMGGQWADTDWSLAMNGLASPTELPQEYEVASVYPNPFNPTANINVALPEAADLSVRVYNINGQMVAELANGQFQAGHHNLVLDGSSLASGLYFVQTQVPGQLNNVQKVTLMK